MFAGWTGEFEGAAGSVVLPAPVCIPVAEQYTGMGPPLATSVPKALDTDGPNATPHTATRANHAKDLR